MEHNDELDQSIDALWYAHEIINEWESDIKICKHIEDIIKKVEDLKQFINDDIGKQIEAEMKDKERGNE